ncbi:MAG: hypothetical protein AABW52_04670 [Nanoarchaeota archaeon]|mgnify:CR=1 FL=1
MTSEQNNYYVEVFNGPSAKAQTPYEILSALERMYGCKGSIADIKPGVNIEVNGSGFYFDIRSPNFRIECVSADDSIDVKLISRFDLKQGVRDSIAEKILSVIVLPLA